jgi:hypothetical protein
MQNGFVVGDRGLGAAGDTHPAWMAAHALADPYLVVGASAVGQIHLARLLPRDDAFLIRSVGPWVAVAVADGLGSRPLSRFGASYAVEALTSLLLRPFAQINRAEETEGRSYPDMSRLAPSGQVENVDFKPVVLDNAPVAQQRGSGLYGLSKAFQPWQRRAQEAPRSPASDTMSISDVRQTASIGWWPNLRETAGAPAPADGTNRPAGAAPAPRMVSAQAGTGPDPDAFAVATAVSTGPALQTPPRTPDVASDPNLVTIVRTAFDKTHLGLREHANSLGLDLSDLGCTALALLLNRETGRGAVGQIGDGALLGLTVQGRLDELVSAPDTGDPQSTYTLNRPNFAKYLGVNVIEPPLVNPYHAFFVMTDGLSGDILFSQEDAAQWAKAIDYNLLVSASPAQAAAGLLNWLATYQVKGSWDDRTLVVITQKERLHGDSAPAAGQP